MKFDFVDFLPEKNIICLKSSNKKDAIKELVEYGSESGGYDCQTALDAVMERESHLSTGLGNKVALPHARISGLSEPHVVIGLCDTPITDYECLDNLPVEIIILIVSDESDHNRYLSILKSVSNNLLTNKSLIDKLISFRKQPEQFIALLKD